MKRLISSFNYAVEGVIYALSTEKNMKIHFGIALIILIFSLFMGLTKIELMVLLLTMSSVIIAEMINTAVEATIDIYTKEFHPLAKIAKNVAAGAVLVAALNSIIIAYLLFYKRFDFTTHLIFYKLKQVPLHIVFISLVIVIILAIVVKTQSGQKHSLLHGGIISGHSAVAFSMCMAISWMTENGLIFTMTFIMALLVAQSRVEGGIHSTKEVIMGGFLGSVVTFILFRLFG